MKKKLLSGILAFSLLLSLIPFAYAENDQKTFKTVYIECPEAQKLFEENYAAYANLLMRYADDKTPIPLSTVYDGYVYATIPAENEKRPLEYFVSEEMEFADEPDSSEYNEDSFYFYIMAQLSEKGVIKGNEKGEALPFQNVTRAEAVAIAMRLLSVDNMPDTDSGFVDVPEDSWYAAAVTKARELGVVAGDDETHFSPMRDVSREEMVALIARCLWTSGLQKETSVTREELAEETKISDCDKISDWALTAYETMKTYGTTDYVGVEDEEGVEYGNDDYYFLAKPQDAASRFFAAYVALDACDILQIYPSQTAISLGFDKEMPKIDGSTSTYPFTEAVYGNLFYGGYSHPEMPKKHSKSHASYERLINGEVDMLFASVYPANDVLELAKEKGVELELMPIAYDAMIFFTNADNTAENLTKEQISQIYVDNKYSNWKEIGGPDALLYPYCRNNDSGSHAQMERHFLNGKEINEKIRKETTSESMENVLTDVMSAETYDPKGYGLGYSIYYYFQNMDMFYDTNSYLKLLAVDGVYPDDDTIASGEYPLSNNTYVVLRKDEPKDSPARKMADFMLTKAGQECVEEAGFGALYPSHPKELKVKKQFNKETISAKDGTELVSISTKHPVVSKNEKSSFVDSMNKTFEETKNEFIASVKEYMGQIEEFYEEADEEYKELFPYENAMDYYINRNSDGIFSITFDESFYTGGAHPFGSRLSYTYDTKTGKELTLCDILGESQEETDKFVIENFYAEYEDEDLWDLEEQAPYVSFYMTNEELVLYFQQYQVAPYAMGFPEVSILLDTIPKG
ncbi:MAG: substrate-binding domain-containing protein [Clostridia bacterium]|nr:substrate-binding domain-containing protein [Clostridia bacterium]